MVGPPGLEPGTNTLWVYCSNQLSYRPKLKVVISFLLSYQLNNQIMVGLVGIEPTTPAMSMQYSTIELKALNFLRNFLIVLIYSDVLIFWALWLRFVLFFLLSLKTANQLPLMYDQYSYLLQTSFSKLFLLLE